MRVLGVEYSENGLLAQDSVMFGGVEPDGYVDVINNQTVSGIKTFDTVIVSDRLRIPIGAPDNPQDGDMWIA